MRKLSLLLILLVALVVTTACEDKYPDLPEGVYAEFVTNKGTFVAELFNDQTPLTTANFVTLAEGTNEMVDSIYLGKPYYNGLIFHRVIKDFMIQGGDPNGDGSGNPGYRFPDEFVDSLKHDRKGLLSMANSGPETNGSQFFVTLKETPWLDGKHTVFGEVVIGQEVVDSIGTTPTTKPGDKPVDDVIMEQVNIIKKGNINIMAFADELKKIESEREAKIERLKRMAIDKAVSFVNLKQEAETMESGLQISYQTKGEGPKPKDGDDLLINYSGYFPNGQLFNTNHLEVAELYNAVDQNRKAQGLYSPIISNTNDSRLIPGFREALQNMRIGDKVTVFIPSHLGYGEAGNRPFIPPNADLIFELEMLENTTEE
jgi:peptidylprolyl isomerase